MIQQSARTELVNGLREIFKDKVLSIILYGSVARNEETTDSDVDIAVVLSDQMSGDERAAFIDLATRLDLTYDRVFSIIDIEKSMLDRWGEVLPFYRNIQNEGVVLWTAA